MGIDGQPGCSYCRSYQVHIENLVEQLSERESTITQLLKDIGDRDMRIIELEKAAKKQGGSDE